MDTGHPDKLIAAAGEIEPAFLDGAITVTTHLQFAGEFVGEVLVKLYKPGPPSYLAMVRPAGEVVTVKRNAATIYQREVKS